MARWSSSSDAVNWARVAVAAAVLCALAASCGRTDDSGSGQTPGSVTCTAPETRCGEACADLAEDSGHCGGCGQRCPSGDQCDDAECSSTGCPGGQQKCHGLCVDVATNPLNCGGCDVGCADAEQCVGGECRCQSPAKLCGDVCTDLASSAEHCGACGQPCGEGERCTDGACTSICEPPLVYCDGGCVDPSRDATACGGCGQACAPNELCSGGACECPSDGRHAVCGGTCTDTATDGRNCGACGVSCPASHRCESSVCTACGDRLFFCPSVGGDPLETCLAQAQAQPPAPADGGADGGADAVAPKPDVNRTCQCEHCLVELMDCAADEECMTKWQCAQREGCTSGCFDAMGQCFSAGSTVCWKFCVSSPNSTRSANLAEALLRCTYDNGCGVRP